MGGKRWGKKSDAAGSGLDTLAGPGWLTAKDAELALHRLCGAWRDQKGSRYTLTIDGGGTIGVITTRPGGKVIRTGGLIRIEWRSSTGRIVWGRAGARFLYKISKLDDQSLVWASGDSYFEWEREEKADEEEPEGEEQPDEEVRPGRKSGGRAQRLSAGFGERRARLRGEFQKQREQYEDSVAAKKDPNEEQSEEWGDLEGWEESDCWGRNERPEKPKEPIKSEELNDSEGSEKAASSGNVEWPKSVVESGNAEECEKAEEPQKRRKKKKSKEYTAGDSWNAWSSTSGQSTKKWLPKLYPDGGQQRWEPVTQQSKDIMPSKNKSKVLKKMLGLSEMNGGGTKKDSEQSNEVQRESNDDEPKEESKHNNSGGELKTDSEHCTGIESKREGKGPNKGCNGEAKEEGKQRKVSYSEMVAKGTANEAKREGKSISTEANEIKEEKGTVEPPTSVGSNTSDCDEEKGMAAVENSMGSDNGQAEAVESEHITKENDEEGCEVGIGFEVSDEVGVCASAPPTPPDTPSTPPLAATPEEEDREQANYKPAVTNYSQVMGEGKLPVGVGAPFQCTSVSQVSPDRKPYVDGCEAGERLLAALCEGLNHSSAKGAQMSKGPACFPPSNSQVIFATDLERHVQSFLTQVPPPHQHHQQAHTTPGGWGSDPPWVSGQPSLSPQAQGLELSKAPRLMPGWGEVEWPLDLQPVTSQLEYYFSDANLVQDAYLRSAMMPYNGWVSLVLLHSYPHMQALPFWAIIQAVCLSTMLELDNTNSYGRIRDKLRRDRWVPRPIQLQ